MKKITNFPMENVFSAVSIATFTTLSCLSNDSQTALAIFVCGFLVATANMLSRKKEALTNQVNQG